MKREDVTGSKLELILIKRYPEGSPDEIGAEVTEDELWKAFEDKLEAYLAKRRRTLGKFKSKKLTDEDVLALSSQAFQDSFHVIKNRMKIRALP